jgi:hypothetical protein
MVDAKPPQERATANFDSDPTQSIDVVQLLHAAERALHREGVLHRERALRLERVSRDLGRDIDFEAAEASEELTCCVGGYTTRQIPCRNSSYKGCPFRNREFDDHEWYRRRRRSFSRER